MSDIQLGKLLDGPAERDAVHIAVLPVEAAQDDLRPGLRLCFVYGSTTLVRAARGPEYGEPGVGIVDPYLDVNSLFRQHKQWAIKKGQRFLMLLLPNTITGLRHHWRHPAIDDPYRPASESEDWLRRFADRWNFDYDEMIAEATAEQGAKDEDGYPIDHWVTARGVDLHSADELGEDHALFWHHLEKLTGRTFDEGHRDNFGWSCSC